MAQRPSESVHHQLDLMTFNIHADTAPSRILDGLNAWPRRRERVVRVIAEYGCDIIGLQECVERQWDYLTYSLQDWYDFYGIGSNGDLKGEITPLLWKRERFDVLDKGTFWINETLTPLQKMPEAKRNRICSWVTLRDNVTQRELTVYNAHFDHRRGKPGNELRERSAEIVLRQIQRISGFNSSVLLGDFNCLPDTYTCSILSKKLVDSFEVINRIQGCIRPPTYHHGNHGLYHLDFVYCTQDLKVAEYEIVSSHGGDGAAWPSDHYPLRVRLEV